MRIPTENSPPLPGLERFRGVAFHSARWDHDHDLRGREVAVVGTGASAIQFVPEIQPEVGRLRLFQRTPPWVLPRLDPEIPEKWRRRFERHPRLLAWLRHAVFSLLESFHVSFTHPRLARLSERRARRQIARQVTDPELRAKLTPNYRLGCKRILGSTTWYPVICAENVDVVTSGIQEVTPGGILDTEGVEHRVDTIIFATGFQVTDPPISHRVLGHNSVLLMIEAQVDYVMQALAWRRRNAAQKLQPRPEAQSRFLAEVDAGTKGSVWTAGGCVSWYLDATGRNSTLWPGSVRAYQRRLARLDPSDYRVESPRPAPLREAMPAASA